MLFGQKKIIKLKISMKITLSFTFLIFIEDEASICAENGIGSS